MTVFRKGCWLALKPVACKSYIAQTISKLMCSQSITAKKEKSENLGNRKLEVGNNIKERFWAAIRDFTESIKRVSQRTRNGATMKNWQRLIMTVPGSESVTCKGNMEWAATITVTWHGTVTTVAGK